MKNMKRLAPVVVMLSAVLAVGAVGCAAPQQASSDSASAESEQVEASSESAPASSASASSSSASASADKLVERSASSASASKAGVSVKASVNYYTWDELSAISQEISACKNYDDVLNTAASYNLCSASGELDGLQVKDVVLSNGTAVQARIVDFATMYSDNRYSHAGITFMFTSLVDVQRMNESDTNAGGWKDAKLNEWLNNDFLAQLPSDLQSVIEPVRVGYGYAQNVTKDSDATEDKLFIPSLVEITGAWTNDDIKDGKYARYINQEGNQFRYFKDQGISKFGGEGVSNPSLVLPLAYLTDTRLQDEGIYTVGEPILWWLRTGYIGTDDQFFCVAPPSGMPIGNLEAGLWAGVAPCFCV